MLLFAVFMLFATTLGAVVIAYVAYPHRHQVMPRVPWLGDTLRKWVDAMPTIENHRAHQAAGRREPVSH